MQELHGARPSAPTLSQVWHLYKEKRSLKEQTIKMYEFVWKWGMPDWMELPITSITKTMIEDRHKQLSQKNGPRGSGRASADLCMRTLRTVINFANQRYEQPAGKRLIEDNPVRWLSEIKQWNPRVKRQGIIKPQQMPQFFEAVNKCSDPFLRDYLFVLWFTGFRRCEGAALIWRDVDFTSNMLTARDTKNGTDHTLPMAPFLIDLLTRRYWFVRPQPGDFVFPGKVPGTHVSGNYKGYEKLFETLGFSFMLHDLRRTFLTTAQACGLDYTTIKWLANHKMSDVTFQYLIKDPEMLRQPIEKISQKLLEFSGVSST